MPREEAFAAAATLAIWGLFVPSPHEMGDLTPAQVRRSELYAAFLSVAMGATLGERGFMVTLAANVALGAVYEHAIRC